MLLTKLTQSIILLLTISAIAGCANSPTPTASSENTGAKISLNGNDRGEEGEKQAHSGKVQPPQNSHPSMVTSSQNIPLENQWTPALEKEFQQRAAAIIRYYANPKNYGNTFQENEKRSYPNAMFDFLAGNRARAIAFLQREDNQAKDNQHTAGIDYYFCFTLKGQMRKYFLLGEYLDPTYRQRMYQGAKKWTEKDPLSRPHPIYGNGDGSGKGWGPKTRGGWVDGRNTDNLRAMRETSVYLMAEETGNEATRLLYKKKIKRYVWALYHIGMGEWDSETYHGHKFAPYLNLYDFAQDREVKQLAKAALDWMSAAAAIKYYRGGWAGPVKRDYGKSNVPFGSAAARTFWLYFGDTPQPNPKPEPDTLHLITSSYRPPQAVVALARKQFSKPVEILSSKPTYENWKQGKDRQPAYWETTFIGETYQMGSIVSTFADGDVAPFKLLAYNSQTGVDYFVANTGKGWVREGKKSGDQIGQYRNLLIWLRPATKTNFLFQLPVTAKKEIENGIWFFELEKTWLAVLPINLSKYQLLEISNKKIAKIYRNQQVLQTKIKQGKYAGFALKVGGIEEYSSFNIFKQKIKQQIKLDLSKLSEGEVTLKDGQGNSLGLTYNSQNLRPFLVRNGIKHNWQKNFALYRSLPENKSPIFLDWKQGNLKIQVGNLKFQTIFNHL